MVAPVGSAIVADRWSRWPIPAGISLSHQSWAGPIPFLTLADWSSIVDEQRRVCEQYKATFVPRLPVLKVGICARREGRNSADSWIEDGSRPWHDGLVHLAQATSQAERVFHRCTLNTCQSGVLRRQFLGLPPGWRFLIADGFEDVWYDAKLLPGTI